nr:MAG TPA: hypothetical protein [Caudoviricetes sp.]
MGRIVGLEIFDDEILSSGNVAKVETGENAAITGEAISDAVAADVLNETKEDKKGNK